MCAIWTEQTPASIPGTLQDYVTEFVCLFWKPEASMLAIMLIMLKCTMTCQNLESNLLFEPMGPAVGSEYLAHGYVVIFPEAPEQNLHPDRPARPSNQWGTPAVGWWTSTLGYRSHRCIQPGWYRNWRSWGSEAPRLQRMTQSNSRTWRRNPKLMWVYH